MIENAHIIVNTTFPQIIVTTVIIISLVAMVFNFIKDETIEK